MKKLSKTKAKTSGLPTSTSASNEFIPVDSPGAAAARHAPRFTNADLVAYIKRQHARHTPTTRRVSGSIPKKFLEINGQAMAALVDPAFFAMLKIASNLVIPKLDSSYRGRTFGALLPAYEALFDQWLKAEVKAANASTATLDGQVEASVQSKLDALEMAKLTPWHAPIDGSQLLRELRQTYLRFLVLPLNVDILLAVWTLHTYVFDSFGYTPYLHVTSPEPECGKSTLADVIGHLSANATIPGGMTAAAMLRRIERLRPTLLVDEWDSMRAETRNAAINTLNTGCKHNGVYTLCSGGQDIDFRTFCPKAIFGLHSAMLPDTTRSRCFQIELQKMKEDQAVAKLPWDFDALSIRRKCLRWANDHRAQMKIAKPVMPKGLGARREDISVPLLAIADVCGATWPAAVRQCLLGFGLASNLKMSQGSELLRDIRSAFAGCSRLTSEQLTRFLNGLETRPWGGWNRGKGIDPRRLAALLKPYRIQPHNLKIGVATVRKGYGREDFEEAWSRYLPKG